MTKSEKASIWIAKLDKSGGLIWDTETGGSALDQAFSIIESSDGNVIVAGAREVKGDRDTDGWLTGYDKRGRLYQQGMFGERYTNQVARTVIRTADGNYLAGGSTQASINSPAIPYLFLADIHLGKVWERSYPDFKNSRVESLSVDQHGMIRALISVHATDGTQTGIALLVINRSGELQEQYLHPSAFVCRENSYARFDDGQFIMVSTVPDPLSSEYEVVKFDKKLQITWKKSMGQNDPHPISVIQTEKKETYVLAGWTGENDNGVMKLEVTAFRDLSDELVSKYVAEKVGEWKLRKEGESEEKYKERLAEKNDKQLAADFTLDARIHYEMLESPPSAIQQAQVAPTSEASETEQITFRSVDRKDEILNIGTYHALLIAVNDYTDPNITDLDQPVKDAGKLHDVLVSDYLFDEANVSFLKNPTREEIITALDRLEYKLTDKDNLLIFYAGHGYWDEKSEKGYWLPSDAKQFNTANWILNSTLQDYIRGIQSKHTLLIADACFGGSIFKTRTAFGNQAMAIARLNELPSRKGMTSGTLTEVPDKSVFVEYLVKRLVENQEKYLPSEQLFYSFKPAVLNNSENIPQFGEIHSAGDEGGDFIFVRKK